MKKERVTLGNWSNRMFLAVMLVFSSSGIALAAPLQVNYILDNVFETNGLQMTGAFQWLYEDGDFENGAGTFSELFIPGHGTDIEALNITFDIGKSIEFSLKANLHNAGVDVTLFFDNALTPTVAAVIDTTRSKYEIAGGFNASGATGGFISGRISPVAPSVIPIPATAWLFGSGVLVLGGFIRRK